jgi:hypothetical protein
MVGLFLRAQSGELRFPQLFWAANAILDPKNYTVTSFAILQQHSRAMNFTCQMLYFYSTQAVTSCSNVKELYEMANVENKIPDGDQAYPNSALSSEKGMEFELK